MNQELTDDELIDLLRPYAGSLPAQRQPVLMVVVSREDGEVVDVKVRVA